MTIEEFLGMLRAGKVTKRPLMASNSERATKKAESKEQDDSSGAVHDKRDRSQSVKSSTEESEEREGRFLTVVQAKQIFVNSNSLYFDDVRPKNFRPLLSHQPS